jgi:4-diphosphocytidyl-2-C-methyl-D-erythritol kinase
MVGKAGQGPLDSDRFFEITTARSAMVCRMNLRQDELTRTVRAPAKLNLYLEVFGPRGDGYHELETLLLPIQLCDWLSFTPVPPPQAGGPGEIRLRVRSVHSPRDSVDAIRIPPPQGPANLVVRALELLRRRSGCPAGACVDLVKRIPTAAGLGGGSSDAAAALWLGNRGWDLGWSAEQLAELAAELGSDVPFFLAPGAAICRGRGERVERLPSVCPLEVVIIKPPAGLHTSAVYRALDAMADGHQDHSFESGQPRLEAVVRALRRGTIRELGRWMGNRLQAAAATLSPWIERVRTTCAQLDFLGHQLSGSGTAYFGVCRHAQHARRLATILRTRQLGLVYVTRSCR